MRVACKGGIVGGSYVFVLRLGEVGETWVLDKGGESRFWFIYSPYQLGLDITASETGGVRAGHGVVRAALKK